MKVRPGILVGAASGSVGNVTASGGMSGHVFRLRAKATRSDTKATARIRGAFTAASRAWGALTEPERDAWNTWAGGYREVDVLGREHRLGGRDAFCRLNSRLRIAGLAMKTPPPTHAAESVVYDFTLVASAAGVVPYLVVAGFGPGVVGQAWVWCTVRMGGRGRRWQDDLKLCVRYSLPGFGGVVPFGQEYLDRWGTLIEGQKLYCVLRRLESSTGFLSLPAIVAGQVVVA